MRIVKLHQSTPEWLDWRKQGVTASDVSALFGVNPYKTEWKLWAEKTGLQPEDNLDGNPYVRRGKMYEQLLREHVAANRNAGIFPLCAEHDRYTAIRVSLDGIDKFTKPWEFKIPSPGNYEEVRCHRLDSEPAQRYYLQIQQQMLVTGASEGYLVFGKLELVGGRPMITEYIPLLVVADRKIQEQIVEKIASFMEKVRKGIPPPKDPARDLFSPMTETDARTWADAAAVLRPFLDEKERLKAQLEAIDRQIKKASEPILSVLADNKIGEFSGIRVTRVDRSVNVDWPALVQSKGLDPTDDKLTGPFRKPAASYHKFSALG